MLSSAFRDEVSFDILIKGTSANCRRTPRVEGIGRVRPAAEDVEQCRRWFAKHGVTCYASGFGLACTASTKRFEELFGVSLVQEKPGPGRPPYSMSQEPTPPEAMAERIDCVTLVAPPELF